MLEIWTKSSNGKQVCFLQEFYNAKDILDKDSFSSENQELETIINFFQPRGLLKHRSNIISFHNCISAIKKFAENNGADALTSILTVQTWIVESKLKTKLSLFLPTFSDSLLTDIEQNPDKFFTSMNIARSILKKLYHKKTVAIEEPYTTDDAFGNLKIIYHGSEVKLNSIDGRIYRNESILTGSEAYKSKGKTMRVDDLLQQIHLESTLFQAVMDNFEQEENSYLANHPELLKTS